MIIAPLALSPPEGGLLHVTSAAQTRFSAAVSFLLASALFLFVHAHQDVSQFFYDARDYWEQAALQVAGPRGYLFPLLLAPARWTARALDESTLAPYRIFFSLAYAAVLTLVLPRLFTSVFGGKVSLPRRLIPCFLLATLFPGLLTYPVSGLPALLFCFGAAAVVQLWHDGPDDGVGANWRLLAAGALAAAAYNTRSIYLFSLLPLFVMVVVASATTSFQRRAALPLLFVAGALLVSLPQLVINKQVHGTFSPSPSPGRDLFAFQLFLGLEVQRYETTDHPDGAKAGVPYIDDAGRRLMEKPGVDEERRSLPNYLEILRAYPMHVLGVYGRHWVNGLDVRDGRLYITRKSDTRDAMSFYGFSLLALAAWILLAPAARSARDARHPSSSSPWLWAGILLLPVAAIAPGAVETRFFVPVYLLAFCTIAFKFDVRTLAADLRVRYGRVLLMFVLALSVFSAISLTTMAQ